MGLSIREDTLLSNIAGNLVRAGQHRPMISGTSATLLNQEVNLHNNLMRSQADRNDFTTANSRALQRQNAQYVQGVNATLGAIGAKKITVEDGIAKLQQSYGKPGDDAAKDLIAGIERKRATEDRNNPLGGFTASYTQFLKSNGLQPTKESYAAWEDSKNQTARAGAPIVNVGASGPEIAELNAIKEVYRKHAQGGYASNEEFLTALESTGEQGKADANDMVKRAKGSAEVALKKQQVAAGVAGEDAKRRRKGVAASTVVDDLTDAMNILKDWGYTGSGTLGRLTRWIPETPAGKVKTYVDSVKSNLSIDTLLKIKAEGSGLGQVPQKQLEELAKTMGPLTADADAGILYQTMGEVKNMYLAIEDNMSPEDRRKVGLPERKGKTWIVDPNTKEGRWVSNTEGGDILEPQSLSGAGDDGWSFKLVK